MTAFYLSSGMPAETVLFTVSLASALRPLAPVSVIEEEPVDLIERDPDLRQLRAAVVRPSRLVVWNGHDVPAGFAGAELWHMSLTGEPIPSIVVDTPRGRHSFPLLVSVAVTLRYERIDAEVPRVAVAAGSGESRRERMALRIAAEARRRGWRHELIAIGGERSEWIEGLEPSEHHPSPTAGELAALLMCTSAVLDPSDESAPPSSLGSLAHCLGIDVVLHSSSVLAKGRGDGLLAVDEWSPDAFCDRLGSRERTLRAAQSASFAAVADEFGRVLHLG